MKEILRVHVKEAGYEEDKPILKDTTLVLNEGETLLLVGPTGSGKSTFIILITGVLTNLLYGYVKGSVKLFGINPLDPNDFKVVPRYVGVVLQSHELQLAMQTPIDEVLFTLENLGFKNPLEKAKKFLKIYGLSDKAEDDIETLSGGEKKRLCLAASTVHEPQLLILDEPTANLDPWGVSEIIRYVREMKRKGKTLIITEHKPEYFTKLADKIAVLENKTIKIVDKAPSEYSGYKRKYKSVKGRVIVKVENLSFQYCKSCPFILENVSFNIREKEIIAVVGPNGSGKTTLGKLLAGFLKPTAGKVSVFGEQPYMLERKELLKKVIYIPQEPDYFFVKTSIRREFETVSKFTGLEFNELLSRVENWIASSLDDSPYRLSFGQKKWLTFTLATLYDSRIIILDEPTAGLDPSLIQKFFEWLEHSINKSTFILLTHDVRVVEEIADRVFIIENKSMREVGIEEGIRYLKQPAEEALK